MAIINDELYAEVQRRVAPFLIGNVMDRAKALIEFCSLREIDDVKGLLGMLNWLNDNPDQFDEVIGSIRHDIDGRADAGMLPRSGSYTKFYLTQAERNNAPVFMRCDNCSWRGRYENANRAKHIAERIDLGGSYTDVECPDCGALVYPA